MANSSRLSPRQRMINLMYIVLTAMLALNVSADVLDGFTQVEDGLNRSNENVARRNQAIFDRLADFAAQNPEKGAQWLAKAGEVREFTTELYRQVDSLKLAIIREADGDDADPLNIRNRDDLESSSVVMLNPATLEGQRRWPNRAWPEPRPRRSVCRFQVLRAGSPPQPRVLIRNWSPPTTAGGPDRARRGWRWRERPRWWHA